MRHSSISEYLLASCGSDGNNMPFEHPALQYTTASWEAGAATEEEVCHPEIDVPA